MPMTWPENRIERKTQNGGKNAVGDECFVEVVSPRQSNATEVNPRLAKPRPWTRSILQLYQISLFSILSHSALLFAKVFRVRWERVGRGSRRLTNAPAAGGCTFLTHNSRASSSSIYFITSRLPPLTRRHTDDPFNPRLIYYLGLWVSKASPPRLLALNIVPDALHGCLCI